MLFTVAVEGLMNRTNDIANLLSRFGESAGSYVEIENSFHYKELPESARHAVASVRPAEPEKAILPGPIVVAQPSSALADTAHPLDHRIEPVLGDSAAITQAVAPVSEPVAVPAIPCSLRSLLTEVALERQAEARAQNEEVLRRSIPNGPAAVTPARVIAVVSPKGGVGKSTLCAALAGALGGKGRRLAIDLDPQNALQYHLGVRPDVAGMASASLTGEVWSGLLLKGIAGTRVLPFGSISEPERRGLERFLEDDAHWLARQLVRMDLAPDDVVIIDTPPGRTLYLEQALDVADQVIVVITPDAASFMTLDTIDRLLEGRANHAGRGDCHYVVNQFDASRTFCQDMLEVLRRRFGKQLIGVVPLVHAISEGLAFGVNPLLEDEDSSARQEILAIGDALKSPVQTSAVAGNRAS
ncbi:MULTISPECIES: cellulose biosynthesis protein BcsQ [Pseudomonas]|uniref:cellulose biosynthesis protein BcsQ n=1 Tax=Pseudomonas TaxID=286 RepID=UPI001BE742B2|nr:MULTISPECIES: cellulose biosynthesis protein BcsQ [Pseudomonas]MBT2338475.1 cellulose synthase operon protein YhjQ [Pseudomonas fluorescens]MCD4531178.1 cellulose synthase operon protein YhjQ [Pseudomonas sp. C3-2018]